MNHKGIRSAAALAMALVMLLSAAGCDNDKKDRTRSDEKTAVGSSAAKNPVAADGQSSSDDASEHSELWTRNFCRYTNFEEYEPELHVDAKQIYASMSYTPQTFYGIYGYEDIMEYEKGMSYSYNKEKFEDFAKSFDTVKAVNHKGEEYNIGPVPTGFVAGTKSDFSSIPFEKIKKYNWMTMDFPALKDNGSCDAAEFIGSYYIEDHKLVFTPITKYALDDEKENVIEYEFADTSMEFDFEFTGGRVTLSNGKESITLTAQGLSEATTDAAVTGYLSSEAQLDNIIGIELRRSTPNQYTEILGMENIKTTKMTVIVPREDKYTDIFENVVGHFNEDGSVQFSWAEMDGTQHAYEMVYFYCGDDGLILTDGTTKYYYTNSYSEYEVGGQIETTDDEALKNLNEGKVLAIAEKKKNLQEELMKAFEKEGIAVECNEETGEMMLDSSVLFDVDQYELSSSGQEFLNKFMKAYSSVILKDDYEGFVSNIMVEGHTDSTGERKHNEELSKSRANEVLNYCVSDKTKIDAKVRSDMKALMEAVGYADDYPILDEGGKEDQEKSRRVSFKFVIDMENASQLEAPEKIDEEAAAKRAAEERKKAEEAAAKAAAEKDK